MLKIASGGTVRVALSIGVAAFWCCPCAAYVIADGSDHHGVPPDEDQ